jgi:hypothetical protein
MSADNYIFIDRKTKPIKVWHCIASQISDNLEDQKLSLIGVAINLDVAIDLATQFEKDLNAEGSYVEYGIAFELWYK